jgi:1-acyl-sn-glycerol-3-phosphate acyltransferase
MKSARLKPKTPYVPQLGIKYPTDLEEHMYRKPKEVEIILDEHYPFLDKSLKARLWGALIYWGIFTLVFAICPVRFGLRIEGRRILKKNRKLFKNGAMTVSNHIFRWDLLSVLQAIRYRRLYFPVFKDNLCGSDRHVIRGAGGIPVPTDIHVIKYFNQAFDELHARKKWFHAFPEGSTWDYYQPIRPFKKGVFTMAWKYNIPVIPMAFSYRPPTGIYRFFKKGYPLITLRIGAPILPDRRLSQREAAALLREQCHKKIVELAGIPKGENPWPCEGD